MVMRIFKLMWILALVVGCVKQENRILASRTAEVAAMEAIKVSTASGEVYSWDNVAMGGGGYITNIIAHPMEPGLIYARTDNGGAYRFDSAQQKWSPLTDQFGLDLANYYGIDGIAIDPANPNIIYICAGKGGSPSSILKSTDRGASWKKLTDAFFSGNGDQRWIGEPIQVDPRNSSVIYSGSRSGGLLRSLDGGASFSRVSSVPAGTSGIGIRTVVVNPKQALNGRSQQVFAAVYGSGIYVSNDSGETFSVLSGAPSRVHRMTVASDGTLFVTSSSGLHRYDGNSFINISPVAKAFTALAVAHNDPNKILVVREYRVSGDSAFNNPIYYSDNGGASWTEIFARSKLTMMASWYTSRHFSAATASATFDPADSRRVFISDWYGTWQTNDITAATVNWQQQIRGHEQMSVLALLSLPGLADGTGAALLSGVADNKGFRHENLSTYPSAFFNDRLDTSSIDFSELSPQHVFKLGQDGGASYSSDHGRTWTRTASWPYGENGRVAVSATDPKLVVVVPVGQAPKRSADLGASWQNSVGAASGTLSDKWDKDHPIASDRVDGNTFYFMDSSGGFYRSQDGGLNFMKTASIPAGGMYMVRATPGKAGDVFVSVENTGLYHSTNGGNSFTKIAGVEKARMMAFGKNPPNLSHPAIFLYGSVSGVLGIYRSDDFAASFKRINTDSAQFAAHVKSMEGDRRVFGRIYIGTGGRGIVQGQLESSPSVPDPVVEPTPEPTPTPTPEAEKSLTVRVSSDSDDGEERVSSGSVNLSSTDLEMSLDGTSKQIVGIRFKNISIPKGAKITGAYIQFTADEVSTTTTSLMIKGHASDNAAEFSTSSFNISSRPKTSSSVAWSPAAWSVIDEADQNQRTPSLAAIVQEILNRPGFASGNSIAFIIEGNGKRVADSFNGSASKAAQLVINYQESPSISGGGPTPTQDTTPPTVSLSSPLSGSIISGVVTISAVASDNVGIASLIFRWDSENFSAPDVTAPYAFTWDTTKFPDDLYTLTAVATDTSGNTTVSSIVTVTVRNAVTTPTPNPSPVTSNGMVRRVPQDYSTIQAAINAAASGDTVLISPGTYTGGIAISGKAITLASLFHTTGDQNYISSTILQSGSPILNIAASASQTRVIGLTFSGGTKGVVAYAYAQVMNNRFVKVGSDAMSLEGVGGEIKNNYFEYPTDDCIDADDPRDALIEGNFCKNASDDGIEIRNYDYTGTMVTIIIRGNSFFDVGEDGVQLIDYPATSNRKFLIHRNLIVRSRYAGVGLMDNGETKQDFRAASMPERVEVINNTLVGNNHGISGGDNLLAVNNIIANSTVLGMKGVDNQSVTTNNLFYGNATNYSSSNVNTGNSVFANPLLGSDFKLQVGSPAIDAGTSAYTPSWTFNGSALDIGTYESP